MEILTKSDVNKVAEMFKNSKVIAFPTETVFGLGVIASNKANFDHLVAIKERPSNKPFTLMFSNINQVEEFIEFDEISRKLIKKFMPGPLTLILPTKKVPSFYDLNTGFVGIRMPADNFVLDVINKVGKPLFVPSCNVSGKEPCVDSDSVIKEFNGKIDGVVIGNCLGGVPSTVAKVCDGKITVFREGPISLKQLEEAL
ncbi:MAG: L-threonylcarbamoyladenylate synthase [Bacilli bacterium]